MLRNLTMIIFVLIFTVSMAFGSGFSIYEQGSKATAMGGAFIAQANDVTSVFYNPAGITSLKGTNFGLGATIIMPTFDFTGPTGLSTDKTDAEALTFYPPHLYITHQINDQWTAGFGVYTLFGLASEWPDEWVGRELNVKTELRTFFFNPVIAYKAMDNLSLAVGASLVYADVDMNQDFLAGTHPITGDPIYVGSSLTGNTTAWAFNAAVQFQATEQLALGLHYRHTMELAVTDGEAVFSIPTTGIPPVDDALNAAFPSSTKGSATLNMPNMIGVGIAYDITEQFTAEFDWMQLGWSSYDKLVLKLEDPVAGETELADDKMYKDSYSLRFGLEYRLNEAWAIRGGYLRDNEAVPDTHVEPTLPENKRHLFSLGFGWNSDNWSVDGFFVLLTQDDREITTSTKTILGGAVPFNGTYTGGANLFGVTLGYAIN